MKSLPNLLIRTISLFIAVACCPGVSLLHCQTIYVATEGNDTNAGSQAAPVATIARAVELLDGQNTQGEQQIVLKKGVYKQNVEVPAKKSPSPLVITAAKTPGGEYEQVLFDGSYGVENAEPVKEMPGVYRLPIPHGFNSYDAHVEMWEADTRIRYRRMADPQTVGALPASYRFEIREGNYPKGFLYFHTSDGKSPAGRDIGFAIGDRKFEIFRDEVTVRGLNFYNGTGVVAVGKNTIIEDSRAWNIERVAIYVSAACRNATIRGFTASDVGGGIYSEAANTVVENCRLTRPWDSFESHQVTQDTGAGIMIYNPGHTGRITNNLVIGFRSGIFCKGLSGPVVAESNTCFGGGNGDAFGLGYEGWQPGGVMRNNIVSGYHSAYSFRRFGAKPGDYVFENNLLWDSKVARIVTECFTVPPSNGSGQGVIMADPQFAAPDLGDFRVLRGSPALRADGTHIGAFAGVPADWNDNAPPTVSLSISGKAQRLGRKVERFWEGDHWRPGGGVREHRSSDFESAAANQWLVTTPAMLVIQAGENAPAQMKLRMGNGAWSEPMPFQRETELTLPSNVTDTTVEAMVADKAGNWSQPSTLVATRATEAPKIKGEPHVYATQHGFAVTFQTDIPCSAKIEWGKTDKYGNAVLHPEDIYRNYSAEDGGEWIETHTEPQTLHSFVVASPDFRAGQKCHYRIVLDDGAGHVAEGPGRTVSLNGRPRSLFVAMDGADQEGEGTAEKPWKTLQFAVDRALPGDKITLRDGVYVGSTIIRHGGFKGAPIVIAAEHDRKVILDGGKMCENVILMDRAPWITLRGLEIRWFLDNGLQFTESPHVTLENLAIWNEHLIKGRRTGTGFYARLSPHSTVKGCLFYFMNEAFEMMDSPEFVMENNTAVSFLHRGCRIVFSSRGSRFVNNSFNFTGNHHIAAHEKSADWKTFVCDYNNFAAIIRDSAPRRPAPADDIKPWPNSLWAREAKDLNSLVVDGTPEASQEYAYSLDEWRKMSGKDSHSIFKLPLFVNPAEGDWRLQPNSPNIGAGKDGATIGALGVAEPEKAAARPYAMARFPQAVNP